MGWMREHPGWSKLVSQRVEENVFSACRNHSLAGMVPLRDLAKEATHEALLIADQKGQFDSKEALVAYATIVAYRLVLKTIWKYYRSHRGPADDSTRPAPPGSSLDHKEELRRMQCCFKELSEDDQKILIWAWKDRAPHHKIGEELGVNLWAARRRLFAAMARFRAKLLEADIDPRNWPDHWIVPHGTFL